MAKALSFDIFAKDHTAKTFKDLESSAGRVSKSLGGIGAVAGGIGIAAVGAEVLSFGKDTLNTFNDVGSETLKLQRYMGGTAENASRLASAFTMTGVDSDTAARAMGIFSKNMANGGVQLNAYQYKVLQAQTAHKKFSGNLGAMAQQFKDVGVSVVDSSGKLRSQGDVMMDVADKVSKMGNGTEKTALVLKLFGRNGMTMLPFLNKGRDGIKELMAESDKMGTTLSGKDLVAVKTNTIAKRQFGEAVKGLQIAIGRELYPILTQLTGFMTSNVIPIVRTVIGFIKEHKDVVLKLGVVIAGLVVTFKIVSTAIGIFNAILAMNPIGLVIVAIVALVAGLIYAWNNFTTFRVIVTAVWTWIKNAAANVVGWFQSYVWPTLRVILTAIGIYYRTLWTVVSAVFTWIVDKVGTVVGWFNTYVMPVLRVVLGAVGTYFTALWNTASAVVGWITDKFNTLLGFFSGIKDTLGGYFSGVWDGLKGAFVSVLNWVIDKWNGFSFGPVSLPHIDHVALAAGGIVTRPTQALIGEAGPEAVIPLSRAGALMGGGAAAPSITINVTGVVSGSADQVARQLASILRDGVQRGSVTPAW